MSDSLNNASTMEQDSKPPTEFTLSKELPSELRLMCWNFAIPPGTRIIKISFVRAVDDDEDVQLGSDTKPSSMLSVCHYSRTTLLEAYTSVIKMNILGTGKLYFKAEEDTIVLGPRKTWDVEMSLKMHLNRAKTISKAGMFKEFKTLACSWQKNTIERTFALVMPFKNLEVLLVVHEQQLVHKEPHWCSNINWVDFPEEMTSSFDVHRSPIGPYIRGL